MPTLVVVWIECRRLGQMRGRFLPLPEVPFDTADLGENFRIAGQATQRDDQLAHGLFVVGLADRVLIDPIIAAEGEMGFGQLGLQTKRFLCRGLCPYSPRGRWIVAAMKFGFDL